MTLLAVLVSVAAFAGLMMMADRRRGTVVGQAVLLAGAAVFFLAIVAGPVAGLGPRQLAALAVGLLVAGSAGMLYHLYLGRFAELWVARGVFVAVYLALAAVYSFLFLSLI
jgi:hypothetical protein